MKAIDKNLLLFISKQNGLNKDIELGFTLIEVIMVVTIITILTTLALPSYFSTRTKAEATSILTSMTNFANACRANAITGDSVSLNQPSTISIIASAPGSNCSTGATITNSSPWPATEISGLRCSTNTAGVVQLANGSTHTKCKLTITDSGSVTGEWL